VHVQDYPARYSPQMGFEGANVLFDTWVHPLMMGLEEHLLAMFREDFEFADGAGPSHLGGHAAAHPAPDAAAPSDGTAGSVPALSAATIPAAKAAVAVDPPAAVSAPLRVSPPAVAREVAPAAAKANPWTPEAENELKKIPFFVRGKARRNTERFAQDRGLASITLETLYDAKAHFRS
jgi:light-independent protochlorophyllide reductase subunit B